MQQPARSTNTAASRQLASKSDSAFGLDTETLMLGGEVFTHRSLPRWVQYIQEHIILGMLIITEMVLNGAFMTTGVMPTDPNLWHWNVFQWFMVVIMFAGGAVIATMTVFSSFASAIALLDRQHPRYIFGWFMFCVATSFAAFEVWAGLYERSQHSVAAMIDLWIMRLPAGSRPLVSPTLFILAFALPLSALVVGFAGQTAKDNRTAESLVDEEQKQQLKLIKEQGKQQRRLLAAQGKGERKVAGEVARAQAYYQANQVASGQLVDLNAARNAVRTSGGDDDDDPTPDDDPDGSGARQTRRNSGEGYGVKSTNSRRMTTGAVAFKGATAELMTAADVVTYIQREFGRDIPQQTARFAIIEQCNHRRDSSRPGRPMAAPRSEALQRISQYARSQGWERLRSRSA